MNDAVDRFMSFANRRGAGRNVVVTLDIAHVHFSAGEQLSQTVTVLL